LGRLLKCLYQVVRRLAESQHDGGVNVLLGDGSVRFLSETVHMTTYRNLAARDDGNPLGEF